MDSLAFDLIQELYRILYAVFRRQLARGVEAYSHDVERGFEFVSIELADLLIDEMLIGRISYENDLPTEFHLEPSSPDLDHDSLTEDLCSFRVLPDRGRYT